MKSRELLSEKFHDICKNVYFQPGANVTMKYPCVTYEFDGPFDFKADNGNFVTYGRYTVTNIYKSPSSKLFDEIRKQFHYVEWDRQFISDGLYHDVYSIYW